MEKILNLIFFNYCILHYRFGKILLVYLNPICWISNMRFYKLGLRQLFMQMERNYPQFLYHNKYNKTVEYFFTQILILFNFLLITLIALLLKFPVVKVYLVIIIISILLSIIESYFFIFRGQKYYDYQKEFIKSKIFSQPVFTLIAFALIVILSVLIIMNNI